MENQYYRTFIGLPLRVEQHALGARSRLMTALDGERISWVDPGKYHVTLRFLGDTRLADIRKITGALHGELQIPATRHLELKGLDSFGPRKRPRVIWLGFEQTDFFDLLKGDVDHALELCGIAAEDQAFRAHLTLGRVRSLKNLPLFYQSLDEMKEQFNSMVFFEKLVFFRSVLGPRGPEYQVLDEILFRQDLSLS